VTDFLTNRNALANLLYPSPVTPPNANGLMLSALAGNSGSTPHPATRGLSTLLTAGSESSTGGPLSLAQSVSNVIPWAYVTKRFTAFQQNLGLTERQSKDGVTKFKGLTATLNAAYRGTASDCDNAFMIGSWAKGTCIRPPRDVDMYYVLPDDVYWRYENYGAGVNKQSALLQEVKGKLLTSYSTSSIRGDGPVVLADFCGWTVEIVPAFCYDESDRSYLVCNTKNGGSYIKTKPLHEVDSINYADWLRNFNARPLIRMLKCWQDRCNVQIRSFHLELLAIEFLDQWSYNSGGMFYYDWMCRDFFRWLISRGNFPVIAPGTFEVMWLGDAWKSRAESAYSRATKACDFERENYMTMAGDEWQKIFGTDIPRNV
jgi:hypothetical protein